MAIIISDPFFQTQIITTVLAVVILISIKKRISFGFDNSVSEELKGFAILAILFSHIGYFLVKNHEFLFPLSVDAGVGVNLFLLLSGYGLTKSSIKNKLSVKDFYLKRLTKLFIPMWIVISCFFIIEFIFLGKILPINDYWQSYLGLFPHSNIFGDLDSPLWYFTIILFYYLMFPLIFNRKFPFISAEVLLLITEILIYLPLPVTADNIVLYRTHQVSFPLGIALASITIPLKFTNSIILKNKLLKYILALVALYLFYYYSIYSGVGHGQFSEQFWSVFAALCILIVFILKPFQIKFFQLFGKFSYEIYLVHWPILYYFDHFYHFFSGAEATIFYLIEFLSLAFILQKIGNLIFKQISFLFLKSHAS